MGSTIRVLQFGMGPIGCAAARLVTERKGLELVGAVDIDPAKTGKDIAEIIGLKDPLGIPVASSVEEALNMHAADVALHMTSSYFDLFQDQVKALLQAGLNVVSTAEELSFPWHDNAAQASELDKIAKGAASRCWVPG